MANVRAARAIAQNLDPAWPKPTRYLGGGVNGRVYETNDGRLMKFVYNYAPEEFEALQKLQGTFVVPRFKRGNGLILNLDETMSRQVRKVMFPRARNLSDEMTVFVMGRVGGSQGMTLRKYLKTYPTTNRSNVQRRVEYLISEMGSRGVSHGNLHDENIIVSVSPTGKIMGMWAIDFGRAFYRSPGKTERNTFAAKPFQEMFNTKSAYSPTSRGVPVRNWSRANVHMMNAMYGKRLSPSWERAIAARRKQVVEEMKQYRSPTRGSKGTSRSLSPRFKAKSASPTRPRSAPGRVSVSRRTPKSSPRRSVRIASLKRKRA